LATYNQNFINLIYIILKNIFLFYFINFNYNFIYQIILKFGGQQVAPPPPPPLKTSSISFILLEFKLQIIDLLIFKSEKIDIPILIFFEFSKSKKYKL
jgi:hypothetical protein